MLRGSAHCVLEPVGWGTPPPQSPRAADRAREANCASRSVCCRQTATLTRLRKWPNDACPPPLREARWDLSRRRSRLPHRRQIANAGAVFRFCTRYREPLACASFVAACSRTASAMSGNVGEAAMRWLVGWSSIAANFGTAGAVGASEEGRTLHPVGAQLLWGDPDPLWAVGDWRPDEVRVITAEPHQRPYATPGNGQAPTVTRLAVLGCCAASDEQLRVGLFAARGGALRHLTAWAGSYTVVVQVGRRITVVGDLAGARPVFYTPWANGTAYATAALPLADLIEAQLDIGHLAALLACPESPEALRDSTPYAGVKRIPPGHALILREGSREITGYEPVASLAVAAPQVEAARAIDGVRDALVEAVRARLTAPR
ncbi:secreted protein, partial [Streptomyces pristinaespiralis ATCC 25486]